MRFWKVLWLVNSMVLVFAAVGYLADWSENSATRVSLAGLMVLVCYLMDQDAQSKALRPARGEEVRDG